MTKDRQAKISPDPPVPDAKAIARLRASEIAGTPQPIGYRQNQLWRLHSVLLALRDAFHAAICQHAGHSAREADLEYGLALSCIELDFNSLNLERELENEHAVAR